ncbi:hypothetical protein D8674_029232 [Pyrus ussuriensis x Pyrus communis]|uniref:Uncharacterized protein n=1 Tax=Pyrus ussuriensis x Pyrus communis TaxID=2448454 RepID=A0A5N5HYG4_9ROSA|nr:hypothetical protein D8674_029232 [Pyrus ussuriensis x Pyrus communis]
MSPCPLRWESWRTVPQEIKDAVLYELSIITDTLDQTFGCWRENVHRGLGKARLRDPSTSSSRQRTEQVNTLTSKAAGLKEQIAAQNNFMNQVRCALQISGIQFLDIELPSETTSQPPVAATTSSQPLDTTTIPPAGECDVEDFFF